MKKATPSEIAAVLKQSRRVAVFGHRNPDGDCFGSIYGLKLALEAEGKEVVVFCDEDLPPYLAFLKKFETFNNGKNLSYQEVDCVAILDSSDFKRVDNYDFLGEYLEKKIPTLLIDHHVSGDLTEVCTLGWVDQNKSSASEMVFDIVTEMGTEVKKELATLILTGIETDTASFQNQNTTEDSLKAAAFLVSRGARLGAIVENAFRAKRINEVKIYGLALERLVYNKKYETVASFITKDDMKKYGVMEDEVSGIANFLNQIKGAKIVFLVSESNDGVKVSMRTRDSQVDLAKLAKSLGGGGHVKASGFEIRGRIDVSPLGRAEVLA